MSDGEIDVSQPNSARMYDYALGGTLNYAADRAAAEALLARWPEIRPLARDSRAFLRRAVDYLAREVDVRQFLDLGSGLPTMGNTHEVAQRVTPDARVVYVDNDPVVLAHARALLTGNSSEDVTAYLDADIRDTDVVLDAARELVGFSRPVALLAVGVLHFIDDEDPPAAIMERYISALPVGSHVVISHVTSDGSAPDLQRQVVAVHRGDQHLRTTQQIRAMFCGLELIEPGLVDVQRWRADGELGPLRLLGGVAVKR